MPFNAAEFLAQKGRLGSPGPEDVEQLDAPATPEDVSKQLVSDLFDFTGLTFYDKFKRGLGISGLVWELTVGQALNLKALRAPANIILRGIRGDSIEDNMKGALRELTSTPIRYVVGGVTGVMIQSLFNMGVSKIIGSDESEFDNIVQEALFGPGPLTLREAINTSRWSATHVAQLIGGHSPVFGSILQWAIKEHQRNTGEEDMSLGQFSTFIEGEFKAQASRKAVSLTSGEFFQREVPGTDTTLQEAIVSGDAQLRELAFDMSWLIADVAVDPLSWDLMLGSPLIQLPTRLPGFLSTVGKGRVGLLARKTSASLRARKAGTSVAIVDGEPVLVGRGPVPPRNAARSSTSVLHPELNPDVPLLHPGKDQGIFQDFHHLIQTEPLKDLPVRTQLGMRPETPLHEIIQRGVSSNVLGNKLRSLYEEFSAVDLAAKRAAAEIQIRGRDVSPEQGLELAERATSLLEAKKQVGDQIDKYERIAKARDQAERNARYLKKYEATLSQVESGIASIPSMIAPDLAATDIPRGFRVEGLPQDLLTNGMDAQPIAIDQIRAGTIDPVTRNPMIDRDGNFRVAIPMFKEELARAIDGEISTDLMARATRSAGEATPSNRGRQFLVQIRRSAPDLLASTGDLAGLERTGELFASALSVETTQPEFEILGIYRKNKETAFSDWIPVATRGGLPANTFPSQKAITDPKGRFGARQKRATELAQGLPMYHHTTLPKALSVMFDNRIRGMGHGIGPKRQAKTVSFTRFDVTSSTRTPQLPGKFGSTLFTLEDEIALERHFSQQSEIKGPIFGEGNELTPAGIELAKKLGFGIKEVEDLGTMVPTKPSTFNQQFGNVRIITTREALIEKFGKKNVEKFKWSNAPKSVVNELEERVHGDIPVSLIKRVEIDPTALDFRNQSRESTYGMLDVVVKGFEEQGIPVVVRPLHLQNEIEGFRPFVDQQKAPDMISRGGDSVTQGSRIVNHLATATPMVNPDGSLIASAEVANAELLRQVVPVGNDYPIKNVEDAMAIVPYQPSMRTPEQWDQYFELTTGSNSELLRRFLPDSKPVWLNLSSPKPSRFSGMRPPYDGPWEDVRLLPETSNRKFNDLGFWGVIDEPVDAMHRLDHPNALNILDIDMARRLDGHNFMQNVRDMLQPVEDALRKNWALDQKLYLMTNIHPETPEFPLMWKAATPQERGLYLMIRNAFDYAWSIMKSSGVVEREHVMHLPNYGPKIYDINSDVSRGILPLDLADMPVNGNIMFGHLKHRYGSNLKPIESITQVSKAYFVGVRGKVFDEPAFNEMLKLSGNIKNENGVPIVQNFPEGGRKYVETWVRALKGHPAVLETWARNQIKQGGTGAVVGDALTSLATFVSHHLYRGFLLGSPHHAFQNFLTQGVLNPAAKHGPFRMMQGIARHTDNAWRGMEPQAALMGSFQAIFEDMGPGKRAVVKTPDWAEPMGKMARKLAEGNTTKQGVLNIKALGHAVEKKIGVVAIESALRGQAFHIGMAPIIERWENQTGKHFTPDMFDQLPPSVQRNALLAGYKVANDINFQYGVHGSNPIMRQVFGGRAMGITFQFMTYYGKELAWLWRNTRNRGGRMDPGLAFRYFEILGVMSHALENVGIDPAEFNIVEDFEELMRRYAEYGEAPLGPVPSMLSAYFTAANTEDSKRAEDKWTQFFELSARATPGFQSMYRSINNLNALYMGAEVNPRTGEMMRPLGDNEELSLLLGTTSVNKAKARRLTRELRRVNRARNHEIQTLAHRYGKAWRTGDLAEMQTVVSQSQKFGLDISGAVDAEINRYLYSRLYRIIENSDKNLLTVEYIKQIIEDFPEAFDERAIEAAQRVMDNRRFRLEQQR